jgi:hypothetical protein
MTTIKIKISDEPRIIATAVRHPFQVILNFAGVTDTLAGTVEGEEFIFTSDDAKQLKDATDLLIKSKINFSAEF